MALMIITAPTLEEIERRANERIDCGAMPIGGVQFDVGQNRFYICLMSDKPQQADTIRIKERRR